MSSVPTIEIALIHCKKTLISYPSQQQHFKTILAAKQKINKYLKVFWSNCLQTISELPILILLQK